MRRPGGVWEVTVPVTNEELALAFQLGDIGAGAELLRNVEGLIRHQASKMCRDDSLLEDMLQEGRAAALAAARDYDAERGALFLHIRFAKNSGGHGGVSGKGQTACLYPSGEVSPAAAGGQVDEI